MVIISEINENDDTAGESSVCASNPGNTQPTKNAQGAVNDPIEGENYEILKTKKN